MSVLETFLYDPLCEWHSTRDRRSSAADPSAMPDAENEQVLFDFDMR
jgi:phosphatidylinositol kinase/protein kinase (PI-3  family)